MSKLDEDEKNSSNVADFYDGKSVFITGVSGFLGSILLEILLKCLPGINGIYILLRPKKGVDPESRKSVIFKKWIFQELLKRNPKVVEKVHVISGDISQPNLGISDDDLTKIVSNVSIVFHMAAVISFFKSQRYTVQHNSLGTKYVVDLCKKIRKLDVLVYSSTAYSNSNRLNIEEIVYKLPLEAQHLVDEFVNGKEGEFEKLVSLCKPPWPNDYAFSKCLSENILNEMASELPVAILRPSICCTTWKGSSPGYIEEGSGLVDFSMAVGKGFARVVHCDPDVLFDLIPADIVINAHIVAAWSVATQRSSSPFVVNCTGGHAWEIKLGKYCKDMIQLAKKNLVPNTFQEPSIRIVQNDYLYWIYVIYDHYIPAYILDIILSIKGSKLRLIPQYKFLEKVMKQISFFLNTTFVFTVDNFNALTEQLNIKDKEMFYMDLKELNFNEMINRLPRSAPFYSWDNDKKSPEKRRMVVLMRTMLITFFKRLTLMLFCYLFYVIFYKLIYKNIVAY